MEAAYISLTSYLATLKKGMAAFVGLTNVIEILLVFEILPPPSISKFECIGKTRYCY